MINQEALLDKLAKEIGVLSLNVQIYMLQFEAAQEQNIKLQDIIKDLHLRSEKKDEDIKNMREQLVAFQTEHKQFAKQQSKKQNTQR